MNNIFYMIQKDLSKIKKKDLSKIKKKDLSKIKKNDYKINYDLDFRNIIVFDLCYF
jgi:hypothetical protein